MAQFDDYNYNIDTISDGSSVDGENSFFTYVVDPNPINNGAVAHEDLFTFVRLRAFPQNRSIITSDNVFSSNDQDRDGIYFIASTKQNDKGYLTTNYTNIGGAGGTVEGLGIKNISISVAMFTPPVVEINFVDVRGAAVFNNHEMVSDIGATNTSKFNAFFRLPYPIFELTVKGFYGKAVTYYLNLQNFNASVDTSSGDFLIKCKFLGYQFAFLNDIITKYVIALNNGELGQQMLSDYVKRDKTVGLLSIPTLLQRYTEIATYTEDFKKNETDYELLKVLNALYDLSVEIQQIINPPSTLSDKEYGFFINYENFNSSSGYIFLRDVGLFGNKLNPNVSNLEVVLNNKIEVYNNLISKYISKHPILNDLKISNFAFQKSITYPLISDQLLDDIQDIIINEENSNFRDLYDLTYLQNKLSNLEPYFFISFYQIRRTIYDIIKKIKDEKFKYEELIVEKLNKSFVENIGFNPTVFNVFEVIFGNVDIFLDIVYDVCKRADTLGEERVGLLKEYFNPAFGAIDVPVMDNRIYPFPAVYDLTGKEIWLGDVVGENNPNFPELGLVNDIINGLTSESSYTTTKTATQHASTTEEKWVPINPLDYGSNVLDLADSFDYGNPDLPDLFAAILSRSAILFEETNVSSSKFLKFAELESAYFASKIQNENVKQFLQNIDVNIFVQSGLQYFNNNLISKSLGNYNFTNSSHIFYYDEATTLLNSKNDYSNRVLASNIITLFNQKNTQIDNILYDGLDNSYKYELNTYCLNKDLSASYVNNSIQDIILSEYKKIYGSQRKVEVPYFSVVKNIKLIDGDTRGVFDNDRNSSTFYKHNAHSNIGKSITLYRVGEQLFDLFYYADNNAQAKAFFFLESLKFKSTIFNELLRTAVTVSISDLHCAYIGGVIYMSSIFDNTGLNPFSVDIESNADFQLIANDGVFEPFSLFTDEMYDFFVNSFLTFVDRYVGTENIEGLVKQYVSLGLSISRTTGEEQTYRESWDKLFQIISKTRTIVIASNTAITGGTITLSNVDITQYLTVFCNTFKKLLEQTTTNTTTITTGNNITPDNNIKIEIYNHLKNIYDKWLSYSTTDGRIYNFSNYIHGGKTTKRLIDHCYFIDRTWSDIGDQAVLNPKPLLIYTNQTDGNIYYLVSRVLKDNNFNFYNVPTYVNYYSKEDVSNMFKPHTTIENTEGGACFIFQYVAGNSKILDLNERVGYFNDGFDLNSSGIVSIPHTFKNRKIPQFITDSSLSAEDLKDYLAKYNLCVFRVAYADQNQNIFERINVSQEEHRETSESILIQNELAGGKGGTKRLYMGADLYNMFSVRSYATEVECLGNLQIQPTQYFQLDNIPLFHGAHMITSVKHYIEPHSVKTTFSGRRISKFSYPIVDKMTAFLNLELNEKIEGAEFTVVYEETGDLLNGTDYANINTSDLSASGIDANLIQESINNQNSPSNPTTTADLIFTVVKNTASAKFVLSSNVTYTQLQTRLNNTFKTNGVSTFGLGGGLCASWVKRMLLEIGIVKVGNASTDAWNWFMGLPLDKNMYYFTNSEKLNDWSFEDYKSKGLKNGSLLFGYFSTSKYKQKAYSQMLEFANNQERLKILKQNKRIVGNFDFAPITHIAIYYNGVVYDLTKGVTLSPHKNFVPIAFYHFLPTLEKVAKENGS